MPKPSSREITFAGPSSSAGKALAIPENLLEPISDAEIARMVKIKEEAFDKEGYFNPGWAEQFMPVAAPKPGMKPIDQYLFREGEMLFPPAVMQQGFDLMQEKFTAFSGEFNFFAGEFGQLMLSMRNMSQVSFAYSSL